MCKVGKDKFVEVVEQSEGLEFVTEHKFGDGREAGAELLEGLKNHFMGECTEVGMYLAMSRQADREGYPEIAEAYKRYAWGRRPSTLRNSPNCSVRSYGTPKTNLYKRMNAEAGACEDKMRLARLAKQENYSTPYTTRCTRWLRTRRATAPDSRTLQPLFRQISPSRDSSDAAANTAAAFFVPPLRQPLRRLFPSLLSVRPILRNVLFLPHSVESAPNALFIPDKTLSL